MCIRAVRLNHYMMEFLETDFSIYVGTRDMENFLSFRLSVFLGASSKEEFDFTLEIRRRRVF